MGSHTYTEKQTEMLQWVVYQIYPRSFLDTNGDGIGDLPGVTARLDYLKELGVSAVWLCPCYKSPNDDNGYDVADYRDIMDEFGTLEDAKKLIAELHARGMKLIMDLVPNHTSSAHPWFQESRKSASEDNPYRDYYYWADEPLTDWKASFGGDAWTYDPVRGQYYLHSYAVSQPDLNWDNPAVVREMQDIVDYWTNLGVDGFRIDVIDQISKDFEKGRNCFGPRLHEYIRALFGRPEAEHLFTVGECWASDIDEIERHAGAERGELTTLFQFDHLECGRSDKFTPKPDSLRSLRDILVRWETQTAERGLIYTLFSDNHDQNRYLSRMGDDVGLRYESATCIATMLYGLKGIPFIYQGQEFGCTGSVYGRIGDFRDIESLNMYDELIRTMTPEEAIAKINFGSRDNARRPMQWNGGLNGGFSDGTPWIPLASRYREINLQADLRSPKSVFRYYRDLLALRRTSRALTLGETEFVSQTDDPFFAYIRSGNRERLLFVCNFEKQSDIQLPFAGKTVLSNSGRKAVSGVYGPYETAVFRLAERRAE